MEPVLSDPGLLSRLEAALGPRFRVDRLVSASAYWLSFQGTDQLLRRDVSIRANAFSTQQARAWFLREAEALAQLDHPTIRHVFDVGTAGDLAWRLGNWIEGEGLDAAVRRGPRPIPLVHTLARALLGALEHAHSRGIIVRRILPSSLIVGPTGRGTLTDLRYSTYALPFIPPDEAVTGLAFMAPEVREGRAGDPASDVYTAAAILYFALTGQDPAPDADNLVLPTSLRPTIPHVFDRLLVRALQADPEDRYPTAWEMYEDFTSEAGEISSQATFIGPPRQESPEDWDKRLRRAFGDDYELLSEVGRGGFGTVYRARDLQLERVVALKVLEPSLTRDPAAVERFRREAQLAARLRHPHVVAIYDIGGRYGLIWYTMELVEGPNLAQLVDQEGPLPRERALRLLEEGLSALAEAHRLGMIHRDVKPENMLIDASGALRITDFGLALALLGSGRYGGASSRSGTPQFASPEQLLGEKVDPRTDLYSLAAVAWYALAGRPPFGGRNVPEILARQTTDSLPSLREERPDVGERLEAVLTRALRGEPNERFAGADEFLGAVRAAAEADQGEPGAWGDVARWLGMKSPPRSPRPPRTP